MVERSITAFQIPKAHGWWQEVTARYSYTEDGVLCPICGGVGMCYDGWFHCDSTCQAIAIIEDGRMFLPVRVHKRKAL